MMKVIEMRKHKKQRPSKSQSSLPVTRHAPNSYVLCLKKHDLSNTVINKDNIYKKSMSGSIRAFISSIMRLMQRSSDYPSNANEGQTITCTI